MNKDEKEKEKENTSEDSNKRFADKYFEDKFDPAI